MASNQVTGGTSQGRPSPPVTIKKYANRRLYNTATSSYVTLDHLAQMVRENTDFVVYDARTGVDITRSVLTQIIVEEESKGQNLLPISFLRQLISLYGDSLQWMVPGYLEQSMSAFARNQERMREYLTNAFGPMFPLKGLEQISRQNLAVFEQAMRLFSPFGGPLVDGGGATPAGPAPAPPATGRGDAEADRLEALRRQLEELQEQVRGLTRK